MEPIESNQVGNARGWLIGELSRLVEIPVQTIRYYERLDLLLKPKRTQQGYRLYSTDALERLLFIQGIKAFGLSLDEIKQMLDLQAAHTIPYATFKLMVQLKIENLDLQIQELMTQRQAISQRLDLIAESLPDRDIPNLELTENPLLNLIGTSNSIDLEKTQRDRHLFGDRSQEVLYMYSVGKRNFALIDLISAKLNGANLSFADFTNAKLMLAHMCEVSMVETKLVGANLAGALMNEACLQKADFTDALLIGADLSGADLEDANFTAANLGGVNFTGANLRGVNFSDAIVIGADFTDTDVPP